MRRHTMRFKNAAVGLSHQQAIGSTGRTWYDPGRSFRMSAGYTF